MTKVDSCFPMSPVKQVIIGNCFNLIVYILIALSCRLLETQSSNE